MTPPIVMLASPIDVTPGSTGSFQDVDLDSYIADLPSNVTGALLRLENSSTTTTYYFMVRKNGSTDELDDTLDYSDVVGEKYKTILAVGVDENKIFEIDPENVTSFKVYVIGYFINVTFLTNMVNKSTATTASWVDVDCAASAPGAIALIFRTYNTGTTFRSFGIRKNGSTDNRTNTVSASGGTIVIVGCDGSQICEQYISSTAQDLYLIGYITSGVVMNLNASDVSIASTGAWTDLTAAPSDATHAIIEIVATSTYYLVGLRKNGSTDVSDYNEAARHTWQIVELDVNKIAEGIIESAAVDFYLVGYFTESASWGGTWGG